MRILRKAKFISDFSSLNKNINFNKILGNHFHFQECQKKRRILILKVLQSNFKHKRIKIIFLSVFLLK